MFFKKIFQDLKIGTKFNLFLIFIFIIGILLTGIGLSVTLQQRAEGEVLSKASILLQTMNSLRSYTNDRVNPLLKPRLETEIAFTPESVPSYSVREVFEILRQNPDYENFFYKDAASNPTNLRDKADDFENNLLERFRNQPELKQSEGFRDFPQGQVFYIARPLSVDKQSCLQCHSTPEMAPKSMLTSYGSENGFGWKLNEIVATQIIYVPSSEILNLYNRSFGIIFAIIVSVFILIFLLFNWLLKQTIIKRIRQITKTAQNVSAGDMTANFDESSKDEIGLLAQAFNLMKYSLELAMDMINKNEPN